MKPDISSLRTLRRARDRIDRDYAKPHSLPEKHGDRRRP
jgi:hypothetical protein